MMPGSWFGLPGILPTDAFSWTHTAAEAEEMEELHSWTTFDWESQEWG